LKVAPLRGPSFNLDDIYTVYALLHQSRLPPDGHPDADKSRHFSKRIAEDRIRFTAVELLIILLAGL